MRHYSYEEIVELAKTEPHKALRLHWEGEEGKAKKTNPWVIVDDVKEYHFTPEEFDAMGYCISEEEYQAEQSQDE